MHRHSPSAKLVATALVVVLSGLAGTVSAAPATATISGRVLAAADGAPLAGWTVLVGNPSTKTVQSSATTDAQGSFTVAELPAATYEVAVRNAGTLYPANGTVPLAPGQTRDVQVAVNRQTVAPPPGPPGGENDQDGGQSWWNNPVVATLMVVGGAILIGVVVDNASDDDQTQAASPTLP